MINRIDTLKRFKTEAIPIFNESLVQAKLDGTPQVRYASWGRWSRNYYLMSGDVSFAGKSWFEFNRYITAHPIFTSNDLREMGLEFLILYDDIYPALTEEERAIAKNWFIKAADLVVTGGVRIVDSDQCLGTYLFIVGMDKLFGTDYTKKTYKNPYNSLVPLTIFDLQNAVLGFVSVLSEGGVWCESSDYNNGTVYLLFQGLEALFDVLPVEMANAMIKFRGEFAKAFIHSFTSDLKDTKEWGDEQNPHDPHWLAIESLMAYLSNYYPEIVQFESDLRTVWNKNYLKPFYARYFYWINPWSEKADWKTWAGNYHVAKGQGQVFACTGWEANDRSIMGWFPSFSKGEVDHLYPWMGDFIIHDKGKWTMDRPRAYNGNVLLGNQLIPFGIGVSYEIGLMTHSAFKQGKYTYMTGLNAGSHSNVNETVTGTILHENSRSIFDFPDRSVTVVIDRIHITRPTPEEILKFRPAWQPLMSGPAIQTIWHTQFLPIFVLDNVIKTDSTISPQYPCTINIKPDIAGLPLSETKQYAQVIPTSMEDFQILVTIIGDNTTCSVGNIAGIHTLRVKTIGLKDIVILSSGIKGPKLVTSYLTNKWGGKYTFHDVTKIDGILAARKIPPVFVGIKDADIYVETGTDLIVTDEGGVIIPPDPTPNRVNILLDEIRTRLIEIGTLNP